MGLIDDLMVTHRTPSSEWLRTATTAMVTNSLSNSGSLGGDGVDVVLIQAPEDLMSGNGVAANNTTQFVWPDDMQYTATNTIIIVLYR